MEAINQRSSPKQRAKGWGTQEGRQLTHLGFLSAYFPRHFTHLLTFTSFFLYVFSMCIFLFSLLSLHMYVIYRVELFRQRSFGGKTGRKECARQKYVLKVEGPWHAEESKHFKKGMATEQEVMCQWLGGWCMLWPESPGESRAFVAGESWTPCWVFVPQFLPLLKKILPTV